jgi:hypothetical protein
MLRKLVGLIAAVGTLGLTAGAAWSAIFIPEQSSMTAKFGALPPLAATAGNGPGGAWTWDDTSVRFNGGNLEVDASVFSASGVTAGTVLLTGVAIIDNLTMTLVNSAATFTPAFSTTSGMAPGGGYSSTAGNPVGGAQTGVGKQVGSEDLCGPDTAACLGAFGGTVDGQILMWAVGGAAIVPFVVGPPTGGNMGGLGVGGVPTGSIPGLAVLNAQAAPWLTGKVRMTGISTNVVRVPGRGSIQGVGVTLSLATTETSMNVTAGGGTTGTGTGSVLKQSIVTFTGSDSRTASGAGRVTLISPTSIDTGNLMLGVTPGIWRMSVFFVPEPGTVLLIVSGAAGLAFIGRKRMKR